MLSLTVCRRRLARLSWSLAMRICSLAAVVVVAIVSTRPSLVSVVHAGTLSL